MPAYEEAVQALYRVPLASFVMERRRRAAALRAAGDEAAAAQLAKRARPTISAWTVNQLWWHAREAFDDLLAAAKRVRTGDHRAVGTHREAIARLRKRSEAILKEAGRGATAATLQRVTTTLAAIAAAGGFEPDLPGTLAADRDPPGFEAMAVPAAADARARRPKQLALISAGAARAEGEVARRESARRAAEDAERKRREAERARRTAERHRLATRLRTARVELARREREIATLQKQMREAEHGLGKARNAVQALEHALGALEAADEG
jgi:hypothetical protein